MKSLIQRLPGLQGSFWNHSCGYSPLSGIVVPHWGSSLGPGSSRGTGWSARQAVEVLLAMTQRWDIFPWPCNCLLGLGSYLWRIALLCCSWTVLEVWGGSLRTSSPCFRFWPGARLGATSLDCWDLSIPPGGQSLVLDALGKPYLWVRRPNFKPAFDLLCDFGQITRPLWALVAASARWRDFMYPQRSQFEHSVSLSNYHFRFSKP